MKQDIASRKATPASAFSELDVQIAILAAQGWTTAQIAERTNMSAYTVSVHLRRIFAKLRVGGRAVLMRRFPARPVPQPGRKSL